MLKATSASVQVVDGGVYHCFVRNQRLNSSSEVEVDPTEVKGRYEGTVADALTDTDKHEGSVVGYGAPCASSGVESAGNERLAIENDRLGMSRRRGLTGLDR